MKALKKIWSTVTTVLVVIMVLCAVFLMGARLLGFQCYNVLSGSMQPKYMIGDLIYVKKVDVNSIKVGDDITFVVDENLRIATHRVIAIDAEKQHFYTKGIANETEDNDPVHFNNVIGVPKFSIPKLGYVSNFVQNPPGTYITLAVGVIVILLVFLPDMIMIGKKRTDEEEATDEMAEENKRLKAELEELRTKIKDDRSE